MAEQSTFERVRDIVAEQLGIEADEVTMKSSITEDLGADSLDVVELIMAFEEEFGGEITDEQSKAMATIGDVVNHLDAQ
jgi:acyl carrier protein